jgi:hypothetical protein
MSIDYTALLTVEQKKAILEQRISQFAAEAYQHSLNKKTSEGLEDLQGAENSEKSLQILEAAITVYKAELDSLPSEG